MLNNAPENTDIQATFDAVMADPSAEVPTEAGFDTLTTLAMAASKARPGDADLLEVARGELKRQLDGRSDGLAEFLAES